MNWHLLIPEGAVCLVFVVLLCAEIFKGNQTAEDSSHLRSFCITSILGCVLVLLASSLLIKTTGSSFHGIWVHDSLASFFKLFFISTLFILVPISYSFFVKRREKLETFLLILWASLIGMFFLASANDLFLLFLCVEIITLSFYIMTAYLKQDLTSIEAGLKYLIMGSLASAFLIFGIALVFASVGSTGLPAVHQAFLAHPGDHLLILGFLFILVGLAFKVGAAPFHLWIPDVYEGAPTPAVAFLSVASKAAGFLMLLRLLFQTFTLTDGQRALLFSGLSALTLLCGHLGALKQTSFKRLLGYSSIAHAGYLLIGLAVGHDAGVAGVLYYLITYALANLTIFLILGICDHHIQSDRIDAYAGLARRSPLLGICLLIAFLSLAGVPGTAGFMGKFLVLLAAVRGGLLWIVALGLTGVVISLYYYLRIIRVVFAEEPSSDSTILVPLSYKVTLGILVSGILLLGWLPAPWFRLAHHAALILFQHPVF